MANSGPSMKPYVPVQSQMPAPKEVVLVSLPRSLVGWTSFMSGVLAVAARIGKVITVGGQETIGQEQGYEATIGSCPLGHSFFYLKPLHSQI